MNYWGIIYIIMYYCTLISLLLCLHLCNHQYNQDIEHFNNPKKALLWPFLLNPCLLQVQGTTSTIFCALIQISVIQSIFSGHIKLNNTDLKNPPKSGHCITNLNGSWTNKNCWNKIFLIICFWKKCVSLLGALIYKCQIG